MEMVINQLLIGVQNLEESLLFYNRALGFNIERYFVDTGTGETGVIIARKGCPDLLLAPLKFERLPSPQHMAFEVPNERFMGLIKHLMRVDIKIRSNPSLGQSTAGTSRIVEDGYIFERFFFADPNQVNIEIITKIGEESTEELAGDFQLELFSQNFRDKEKPHP